MDFQLLIATMVIAGGIYLVFRKLKTRKSPIREKVFDSREKARESFEREVLREIYNEYYYVMPVRCKNCKLMGRVRILKTKKVSEGECPRCNVASLDENHIKLTTKEILSPELVEPLQELLNETTANAVSDAWDTGRIKRRSIFE